jgi:hypothetical protein
MRREEIDLVWFIVAYGGGLCATLVFLRTIFVPPKTSASGEYLKAPFEVWLEYSQKRAQEDLRAELEKYRIDRGLAHPSREPHAPTAQAAAPAP